MKRRFPRIIIAGTGGGSGKTTVSLAVIAGLRQKGVPVVPFKKGPDYIDAGWLSAAAGNPCFNLDPFLIGRGNVRRSFLEHAGETGCAVIEGNRGLYDGMDVEGTYSTAAVARLLKCPVVVVFDCTKVTRTAAALISGLQKFDRGIKIQGVILNRVAGERHERVIRSSVEKYCHIPVLGALPKLSSDFLPERHMGLTPFQEHPEVTGTIAGCSEIARKYIDLDGLAKIARGAGPIPAAGALKVESPLPARADVTVGIIRDSAFQFYYPENFMQLERAGVRLVEISALTYRTLPKSLDALYIGGGFPETHAIALARNGAFRKSVRQAVENGLPVYGECGGLMYLGDQLVVEGKRYPMTGVFPLSFCLEKRPQAHGYTIVRVDRDNPFFPRGTVFNGHEFHYSRVLTAGRKRGVRYAFRLERGVGIRGRMDGVCYKNTLATYSHSHALGVPSWVEGIAAKARMYRQEKE